MKISKSFILLILIISIAGFLSIYRHEVAHAYVNIWKCRYCDQEGTGHNPPNPGLCYRNNNGPHWWYLYRRY